MELEKPIYNELKPVASVIDVLRRSDCAPVLILTVFDESDSFESCGALVSTLTGGAPVTWKLKVAGSIPIDVK